MSRSEKFARLSETEGVRDNLRKKSVVGALFTAAGGVLDFGLRLVSTLILARLLIPEQFGLIAMVAAVTAIAGEFVSLGLSSATVQAREVTQEQCTNLFWINVAAGGVFGLIVAALAPLISDFYQEPRLIAITLALSSNFLWGGLTVQHEALLTRQMKQPQLAGNRLLASFASSCLAVILALGDYGYWALVWREVLRPVLIALGVWLLCPWLPGLPTRGTEIGSLLRFGRDMTLTQVLISTISRLDSLLIGKFAGAVALGLYRQAYNLIMAPIDQVNSPIYSVSQPGLSMLQAEPDRYRRYYERILFAVSLATIPLGFFFAIYAKEIILVVLGRQWMDATIFLQIFAVAAAIRPAVGTSGLILVTCGKSGRFLVVALVHSVALTVLMAIGVPWGAEGIAVGHVAATVLLMPWKLYYSFSGTPVNVRDFMRSIGMPLFASIVMALVLTELRSLAPLDGGHLSLLAGCSTAAVSYVGTIVLVPDGRAQLSCLVSDILGALQRRSGSVKPRQRRCEARTGENWTTRIAAVATSRIRRRRREAVLVGLLTGIFAVVALVWWVNRTEPRDAPVAHGAPNQSDELNITPTEAESLRTGETPLVETPGTELSVSESTVAVAQGAAIGSTGDVLRSTREIGERVGGAFSPATPKVGSLPQNDSTSDAGATRSRTEAVVLHFVGDSWASVTDADGSRLLYETVRKGGAKTVQGKPPFRLVLGRPANVRIEYNGRSYVQKLTGNRLHHRFNLGEADE